MCGTEGFPEREVTGLTNTGLLFIDSPKYIRSASPNQTSYSPRKPTTNRRIVDR
jgi:hypothetical protein